MSRRLPVLTPDQMTPDQLALHQRICSGPRRGSALIDTSGGLVGPFNAMLYAPTVGEVLQELGAAIRYRSSLPPRMREAVILLVAYAWDSEFERAVHEPLARAAGLTDTEIAALRDGVDPGFSDPAEQAAHRLTRVVLRHGLLRDGNVDDAEYDAVSAALGHQALVEVTTLIGYYVTLALQLRLFGVPGPAPTAHQPD